MRKLGEPIHYCEDPRVAVCGRDLSADDFRLLYDNCTSCFADVTCPGCRAWLHAKLSSRGFSDPDAWAVAKGDGR